jgi:hypothetical protein
MVLLACLCKATEPDQPPASGSSSGSASTGQRAAWELVRLVPHAAACIQALAAGGECPRSTVAAICGYLGLALRLLSAVQLASCTPTAAQLEAWAAAAEAGVRLQPLLARLHSEAAEEDGEQQQQQQQQQQPFEILSMRLLDNLWAGMLCPQLPLGGAADDAGRTSLAQRLWRLHSTSCRLLHWLAADSSRCLAAFSTMGAYDWELLSSALDSQFWRAHSLLCPEKGGSPEGEQHRWV